MMTERFRSWWNEFFFAREVPYGTALVRITLPLALLVGVLPRWQHARELYSTDGTTTPLWVSYGTAPLLPDLSATAAVALYSVLVLCLITACLGWRTRISLITSTVLYAGFGLFDQVSTLTKYTVLSSHVLLLLALSDCGAVWSLDALLARRRSPALLAGRPTSPIWPKRMIQLLLAICYLGAAFTKMHTPEYFSGDQMVFWLVANMNFENRLGEYLSLYPPASVFFAYVVIVWEILFIALVWRRPWQFAMLGVGVLFHIMTAFTLGLIVFPLLCLSLYLVFLEESDVERLVVGIRTRVRQMRLVSQRRPVSPTWTPPEWIGGSSSTVAFLIVAAAVAVVGVEIEHRLDVYQERGASGPLVLNPMDEATAAAMLSPSQPIRPKDLFFSFDVGTTTMAGLLADRRATFEPGDKAILQCNMTPPHPDMWVEIRLHDSEDRPLRRYGQIVPRESLRSNFTFKFDESIAPGVYDFVLIYDDHEISRRRIRYHSGSTNHRTAVELTAHH